MLDIDTLKRLKACDLDALPTLGDSGAMNLKIQDGEFKVWLDRCYIGDHLPSETLDVESISAPSNLVIVERGNETIAAFISLSCHEDRHPLEGRFQKYRQQILFNTLKYEGIEG